MHCLVIDDSAVVRTIHGTMLKNLGFRVTEAEDGVGGLVACGKDMPDVVLVDWNMPVMDGIAFVAELRKLDGGDRPKVLFCSVEDKAERVEQAVAAGADDYITKPFELADLIDKLRGVGLPVSPLPAGADSVAADGRISSGRQRRAY